MGLPEKPVWRPGYSLNLRMIYDRALEVFPNTEIVSRTSKGIRRFKFVEVAERIKRLAGALNAIGVKKLDTVATLDWNTHWHYESYFAIPMMGAVLHTVNIRFSPAEIIHVMNNAEDKVIITHKDFIPLIEAIAKHVKSLKHIIVVDSDEVPSKISGIPVYHYEDLIKELGSGYEFPEELDENLPAAMCHTGGTTGLPKGAYHTHRMLVIHALAMALHLATFGPVRLSGDDVVLYIVPMFHVYSWGLPYSATMIGVKQVFPNKLDVKALLELIEKESVTFTGGVPTVLYMMLTHPESEKYNLKGLKFITGGAALPKGLAYLALKRGINIVGGYGLTETAPAVALGEIPHSLAKGKTQEEVVEMRLKISGYPVPLMKIMVADEDMNPVPKDGKTMGEIVLRAPWITPEYYKEPEKTEVAWREDWFHTGDIAVWFPDGSILIQDRAKDLIKSGGEWISSLKLENAISTHPGVGEVAVIAAKHPKWQERSVALIVPRPGWKEKLKPEDIIDHLKKNFVDKGIIPKWWLPDKVIIVESLPKTSIGKINKRLLREKYSEILLEKS